ncbi:MAG TPA: UvrD-helicase domain-containing protein [Candidatus Binatia bacterium]|nr:UvrD-helicase domain-containing protein [Candidatus Binatia bacterium]
MELRIADTFTDSLARLTGEEQKAVKTTAFDLQLDPASPGMRFHRLDKARDKNFWSVRVSADIRLIVHRSDSSLLLCYVDHHDKAYDWAERRRLQTHPKTGAAQLVEIRETVQEVFVPVYVLAQAANDETAPVPALFAAVPNAELLGYGVPAEWLADVKAANADALLSLIDHLPAEAAEALMELATGGRPRPAAAADASAGPFDHPDAQRRFRVMGNVQELERALEFPWDRWTVFLHPEQRQWVERDYSGPARVSGSAGTGKTIVALHRAAHLARTHPDARILLTTFTDVLANALRTRLKRLLGNEPRLAERIDVHSLRSLGLRLYKAHVGPVTLARPEDVRARMAEASAAASGHRFTLPFLLSEWEHVVDAWDLTTWESYRDVARLGRKTRLPEAQRHALWSMFEHVREQLSAGGLVTEAQVFHRLAAVLAGRGRPIFDYAIVDEAQDLGVPHLKFFAALGAARPDALFFAGDLGQRIFQQPFSWKALGVDIRGRSRTLRVNYRTSHQIRTQADRLLGPVVSDVDGNSENRSDTISVFNGLPPVIRAFASAGEEVAAAAGWLCDRMNDGLLPHEIAVFVRSEAQIARAQEAVATAGLRGRVLDEDVDTVNGCVSVSTMHLAKGLEFRAVAVIACDDEIVPLQERIENVGDDADLREVYETERHLLYVACTRARDHLLVTGVEPASEFLDDIGAGGLS